MAVHPDNARVELAAAFRLAARFDLHEGICNHFSFEISSEPGRYLINPYGLHWSQMTASALLLVDGDGVVIEGDGEVERTALYIHVAGHRASPRHKAILHTHQPYATALTLIEDGELAMAHQTAARFYGRVGYDRRFGGLALSAEEGEAIAAGNQGFDVMFLAHHGVVCSGPSIAHAFDDLYYLERACRQQVLAMSTGRPLKRLDDNVLTHTAEQARSELEWMPQKHFAALLRVLDAEEPEYAT